MENREITLKFVRVLAKFSNACILVFEDDNYNEHRVKGPLDPQTFESGLSYRLFGRWYTHHKYGRQFNAKTATECSPNCPEEMKIYLQKAPGLTAARAQRIVGHYGINSLTAIVNDPKGVFEKVRMAGLTLERVREAAEWLSANAKQQSARIELTNLLQGRSFPSKAIDDILRIFGNDALARIRKNPYILMDVRGVGFKLADNVYLGLDLDPASLLRQGMCVWQCLRNLDGDTWAQRGTINSFVRHSIGGAEVKLQEAIDWAKNKEIIIERDEWFAEKKRAHDEDSIAVRAAYLARCAGEWPSLEATELTDHQRAQLQNALTRRIGVFCGAPGTGKTHAIAELVYALHRAGQHSVALCAPTGKAAARLTEVVRKLEFGETITAKTIHRTLGCRFVDDNTYVFQHGEGEYLPYDYVIVDECSMLSTDLCADLMRAIPQWGHVLFVGDLGQLPPVGHGAPMRDFVSSPHIPCGELTEIVRSAGDIVRYCHALRQRKPFLIADEPKLPDTNLILRRATRDEEAVAHVDSLLTTIARKGVYDPTWDAQVIVPAKKSRLLGTAALNVHLQRLLNGPNAEQGRKFWIGDKAMCVKNSWLPAGVSEVPPDAISKVDEEGELMIFVANGELGEVVDVEPLRIFVIFQHPEREVIVPLGEEGEGVLELGYAITAHKSQGSEWPIAIVVLDGGGKRYGFCDRSWLYTAVSRAQKICVVVGDMISISKTTKLSSIALRETRLVTSIEDEVEIECGDSRPSHDSEGRVREDVETATNAPVDGAGGPEGESSMDVFRDL